jgi:hypothetical protein
MEMKLRHGKLMAILVMAAACLAPATASAAGWEKGDATCYGSWIYARPIVMHPTNQDLSSGSTFVFGGTEKVAYQANLAKLIGGTWYTVQFGRWTYQNLTQGGNYSVAYSTSAFFDLQTNVQTSGTTTFPVNSAGLYRVYYNMYWYATGEYLWDWANHLDVRTNMWDGFVHPSCLY